MQELIADTPDQTILPAVEEQAQPVIAMLGRNVKEG